MATQGPPNDPLAGDTLAGDSLDDEACWISAARAAGGHDPDGEAARRMVERLRRLEASERTRGGSRQTLQRIMSARRLLGDTADLGPYARPFSVH